MTNAGRRKKFTDAEVAAVKKMFFAGVPLMTIKAECRLGHIRCKRLIAEQGWTRRRRRGYCGVVTPRVVPEVSEKDLQDIARRYADGESIRAMARDGKRCDKTIGAIIKHYKLKKGGARRTDTEELRGLQTRGTEERTRAREHNAGVARLWLLAMLRVARRQGVRA